MLSQRLSKGEAPYGKIFVLHLTLIYCAEFGFFGAEDLFLVNTSLLAVNLCYLVALVQVSQKNL